MTNGYAFGQLAQAFLTSTTHESAEVRRRADRRARDWMTTLDNLANGRTTLGSRTPVRGLPAWVTLNVMRGGFATGRAAADVPFEADEAAWAAEAGIAPQREILFGYFLTDSGVARLHEMLDSGAYRIEIPEDAVLLAVGWLLRAGDRDGALAIVEAVAPLAGKLRFAPKRSSVATAPADHVHRTSAGEAAVALAGRRPNKQVESQREVLSVWNPFFDRVVALWLEKFDGESITTDFDAPWRDRAASTVAEYKRLAAAHTLSTKHRRPKENGPMLLDALAAAAKGQSLKPAQLGRVREALTASIRKRGVPGTAEHAALRRVQSEVASAPAHWRLAGVAAERLSKLDPQNGLTDPSLYAVPVSEDESTSSGLPAGAALPSVVGRVLARTHSAPIETLLAEGVVPSAEVLAGLTPALSATVVAASYEDPALARLAAANYRAFRARRSLLLTNLEKQVQLSELPWVRAIDAHGTTATSEALAVAHRVGSLALDHFPATITPNPLIQELSHLLREAGKPVVLLEELAADIFEGRFSDKYRRAAQAAVELIGGTLYARYYSIDGEPIRSLAAPSKTERSGWIWRRSAATDLGLTFGDLCWARSGQTPGNGWSVARNGMVIEQSQILTTHNLAALVAAGIQPTRPWSDLARDSFVRTGELLALAVDQERPLATVKDAAYAWRQGIFFASVSPDPVSELVDRLAEEVEGSQVVMSALFDGLREVADGRPLTDRPFLGWTADRHWILELIGWSPAAPRD